MDKLMVENQQIDIERQLAEYRELTGRRRQIEQRIQCAEAEKGSVKDHIFEKVCAEYRKALEALAGEIQPVEQAVDKTRQAILDEIKNVEIQMRDVQDQLDELAFRCRVGEFKEDARDHKENPLRQQMETLETQIDDLNETIERFSIEDDADDGSAPENTGSIGAAIEDIIIDAPRENAGDNSAARDKFDEAAVDEMIDVFNVAPVDTGEFLMPKGTIDEPPTNETPPPAAPPEFVADPFAENEPGSIVDESHVSDGLDMRDDGQDLVDPSKWVGEFVGEERGTAPASEASPPPADDDDPLSALADPSDDGTVPQQGDPAAAPAPKPPAAAEMQGFPVLVLTKGAGAGKKLPLLPMTMTLGREHDNNIELKDTDVARYHARISFERGEYVIEDLEGSSGTWVNGEKIDRAALSPGDVIKAGGVEMTIELE